MKTAPARDPSLAPEPARQDKSSTQHAHPRRVVRELDLPRGARAPRLARQALAQWYGESLEDQELEAATLVASELVTNAVVHGIGQIRLNSELDKDRLLIEVIDDGTGFEHTIREVPFHQVHGRGLAVVDAVSSRWGIHEGTTHVWAEIERPGPRLGTHEKPGTAR